MAANRNNFPYLHALYSVETETHTPSLSSHLTFSDGVMFQEKKMLQKHGQ